MAAAAKVDVAVLVLGDNLQTCAEMGDRSSLSLLGGQQELLRRVSTVAKKTIVVLIGGRQLTFESGYCVEKPKLLVGAAEENDDGIPKVEVSGLLCLSRSSPGKSSVLWYMFSMTCHCCWSRCAMMV